MGDWLLLPTELWCQVIDHIQCVFDRTELSLTCSRLHAVVPTAAIPGTKCSFLKFVYTAFVSLLYSSIYYSDVIIFSAPLPAFRSYYNKLVSRDQCLAENNSNTAKRRHITQEKQEPMFSFGALVQLKDLVMGSDDEEELKDSTYIIENPSDVFLPHFIDLVLSWIILTKPPSSVVKTIWKRIVAFNATERRLSYGMLLDFTSVIRRRSNNYDDDLELYPVCSPFSGSMNYQNISYGILIASPIETLKRVKEIGHCVLGLPLVESKYRNCTELYVTRRDSNSKLYTLAIQSGYYVVRNTTFKEFHEQCIQTEECRNNVSGNCLFRYYLVDLPKPLFYNFRNPYISLFLNRKEVVYDCLSRFIPGRGQARMEIMHRKES